MNRSVITVGAALLCLCGCEADEFADYAKVERTARVETGIFGNPGFEDQTKYGRVDEHSELGRFGYNGGGGLRVWTHAKNRSHHFRRGIRLEFGKKYLFTAYVRRHKRAWAMPVWESTVNGKYADNNWGGKITKLGDGWQKCEVAVVPKTPGERSDRLFLYMGIDGDDTNAWHDVENYVDVDNVSLVEDAPEWNLCNMWPIHNTVYSDNGRVRFSSVFSGSWLATNAVPVAVAELLTTNGTRLAAAKFENPKKVFTVDFGKVKFEGPAKLRVTLFDRANRLNTGSKEIAVTVAPTPKSAPGRIFIDEAGRVTLNGRPYMPLGFFSEFANRASFPDPKRDLPRHFAKLRAAGFDSFVDYSTFRLKTKEDRDLFFGLCDEYGLKMFPNDFGYWTAPDNKWRANDGLVAKIRELAAYPSVVGWFYMDEATYDKIPALEWGRRVLNTYAPGKMVWPCNILDPGPFAATGDVQGGDMYPFGKSPDLSGMDESLADRMSLAPAAAWYGPQCYNWADTKLSPEKYAATGMEPGFESMLSIALMMASHGVNGFFFYSYFDIPKSPVKEYVPERWANVAKCAAELRRLEPFITSGEKPEVLRAQASKGGVRVVALKDAKGARRILVLALKSDNAATFALPKDCGNYRSRFGRTAVKDGVATFTGGSFTCDILEPSSSAPTVVSLDDGWKFSLNGGEEQIVDLPHDWAIAGPFTDEVSSGEGCLMYCGKGVYRREIALPEGTGDAWVEIEGAMSRATVYLNNKKIGERPYGYSSFRVPVAESGALEVRLDNQKDSARWYPGAGLNRHVRLVAYRKGIEHLVPGTVCITTPEVSAERATVKVAYETTKGKGEKTFTIERPLLWSPETPSLYRLELFGETFTYGIRKVEFDPKRGFFLNGRHRQMKGVCQHSDLGPLGIAAHESGLRRQLEILKEMGCDAIRTSHNPPAPALLDLCDEMGFFVLDEAFDMWEKPKSDNDYGNFFKEWSERDLRDLIARDRNHPCVVMWSVGNEVCEHNNPDPSDAIRIVKRLTAIAHDADPTRPTTCAYWDAKALTNGIAEATEIVGFNYLPERYADFHRKYPDKGILATETCSLFSSRGFYALPVDDRFWTEREGRVYTNGFVNGQVSSYDVYSMRPNNYMPDVEFAAQAANTNVYGEFVWTGFDYLGEPDPWRANNVARSSYFGIVDLCGFPKDRYYLYQAVWRPDYRQAHIAPHWTWPGRDGEEIPVQVYTSGTEAELFLNGKSLGRKARLGAPYLKPELAYRFRWKVPYEPGELKVKTWNPNRHAWCEASVRTAGAPAGFVVETDRVTLDAGGKALAYVTLKVVDKDGNLCPTATNRFRFAAGGPLRLAGVCNGDPTDRDPFGGDTIRAFGGLAQVIVRAKRGEKGEGRLTVACEGCGQKKEQAYRVR